MNNALTRFVDHLERCQLQLHGTVPPVAAREIAKMRQILAENAAEPQHPPIPTRTAKTGGSIHPPT